MTPDCGHGEAALSNDSDNTGFLEESIESSGAGYLETLRIGNYLLILQLV